MRVASTLEIQRASRLAPGRTVAARGFTLVELMVTAAILTVLAGITLTAVETLRPKADTASFAAKVAAALSNAKFRATAENEYVYFRWVPAGVDSNSPPFVGYVVCATERADYVPPDTFDPADPCGPCPDGSACARPLERQALPPATVGTAGTDFTNTGALPAAFRNTLDLHAGVGASGCSFCAPNKAGWIRFLPRGEVRVQGGSPLQGAALVFKADYAQEDTHEVRAVIVTAPYGLVRSFADG